MKLIHTNCQIQDLGNRSVRLELWRQYQSSVENYQTFYQRIYQQSIVRGSHRSNIIKESRGRIERWSEKAIQTPSGSHLEDGNEISIVYFSQLESNVGPECVRACVCFCLCMCLCVHCL